MAKSFAPVVSLFLLLLTLCIGCSDTEHNNRIWSYTEEKAYSNGIVVSAIVTAEKWAYDEPPSKTRRYFVSVDGERSFVGQFSGTITNVARIGGVVVVTAYSEFAIRDIDGVWSYMGASSSAELHRMGMAFAPNAKELVKERRRLEIMSIDPASRRILMKDRYDPDPVITYSITFDENGENLNFARNE